jgi:hypothetical protein
MFSSSFLFFSLIWGSVGLGYFIYGKKQGSWPPLVGGVSMMAVSYLVGSVLVMSIVCGALIGGVHFLLKHLE